MSAEIRIIAILAGIIVVAGLAWLGTAEVYDHGLSAGKAEIQTAWDTDSAKRQKVTDQAIAAANLQTESALLANDAIKERYDQELAQSAATTADLSRRLRDITATAHRGPVPQGNRGSGAADPGPNPGLGSLNDALASTLTECAGNRAQLNALIAQVRPQL